MEVTHKKAQMDNQHNVTLWAGCLGAPSLTGGKDFWSCHIFSPGVFISLTTQNLEFSNTLLGPSILRRDQCCEGISTTSQVKEDFMTRTYHRIRSWVLPQRGPTPMHWVMFTTSEYSPFSKLLGRPTPP